MFVFTDKFLKIIFFDTKKNKSKHFRKKYSETLNNEYIGRIYQMSS